MGHGQADAPATRSSHCNVFKDLRASVRRMGNLRRNPGPVALRHCHDTRAGDGPRMAEHSLDSNAKEINAGHGGRLSKGRLAAGEERREPIQGYRATCLQVSIGSIGFAHGAAAEVGGFRVRRPGGCFSSSGLPCCLALSCGSYRGARLDSSSPWPFGARSTFGSATARASRCHRDQARTPRSCVVARRFTVRAFGAG